jgi:hypothetical protein
MSPLLAPIPRALLLYPLIPLRR